MSSTNPSGGSAAMNRRLLVLMVLAMLSIVPGIAHPTQAKASSAPLILIINGDLWSWMGFDQSLKQLTEWGYNSAPVISPDGKYVAYKSLPQFVVDDIKQQGGRSGYPPSNFWVMNLATGDAVKIADQPADANYADNGKSQKFTLRPTPAWSPDSKSLAWGEIVGDKLNADGTWAGYDENLVIYDLDKKASRVIVKGMPFFSGITEGDSVDWRESGMVYLVSPSDDPSGLPDTIYVYGPDGKQLAKMTADAPDCPCNSASWIKDGSKTYILVTGVANKPFLIDPDTQQKVAMTGTVDYWPTDDASAIHLYQTQTNNQIIWHVTISGQPDTVLGAADNVALSPDGRQVAYIQDGNVFVYSAGQSKQIALKANRQATGMAWGPVLEPQIQH